MLGIAGTAQAVVAAFMTNCPEREFRTPTYNDHQSLPGKYSLSERRFQEGPQFLGRKARRQTSGFIELALWPGCLVFLQQHPKGFFGVQLTVRA